MRNSSRYKEGMSSLQALLDKQEKGSTSGDRGYSGGGRSRVDWSSRDRDDNNNFRRERQQPQSSRGSYNYGYVAPDDA